MESIGATVDNMEAHWSIKGPNPTILQFSQKRVGVCQCTIPCIYPLSHHPRPI